MSGERSKILSIARSARRRPTIALPTSSTSKATATGHVSRNPRKRRLESGRPSEAVAPSAKCCASAWNSSDGSRTGPQPAFEETPVEPDRHVARVLAERERQPSSRHEHGQVSGAARPAPKAGALEQKEAGLPAKRPDFGCVDAEHDVLATNRVCERPPAGDVDAGCDRGGVFRDQCARCVANPERVDETDTGAVRSDEEGEFRWPPACWLASRPATPFT